MFPEYVYAGFYLYQLNASFMPETIVHIREYLYSFTEEDNRKSGEKQFDYVDPKNREVQEEMESACTVYLKYLGAFLKKKPLKVKFKKEGFPCEASVIIPVRNRVRTIEDAIRSVFRQQTNFDFNLIIVDNHSTDGTTEVIQQYAEDKRLIHLIPERDDLGIGGCWNEAAGHPSCGKFCVQLDSDDVYSGPDTLQKIVDAFYAESCAMVIGTYKMTDFDLNEIAPGIIDHREWTEENGRNNALRINGLGAPRAFYTPILRELKMPNVSYGEDYAIGLAISRIYRIGRIYDVLYLCRRWEDNTDAALDIRKTNEHNAYKDSIRAIELGTRRTLNQNDMIDKSEMNELRERVEDLLDNQIRDWELVRTNTYALASLKTRYLYIKDFPVILQFNPERIRSSAAKTDTASLQARPCFSVTGRKNNMVLITMMLSIYWLILIQSPADI